MIPQRAKILVLEEQISFEAAAQRMLGILSQESFGDREVPCLVRIEVGLNEIDLFDVLLKSSSEQKFYWSDRNRISEWMGLGTAVQLTANSFSSDLMSQMKQLFDAFGDELQFFGGTRFSKKREDESDILWNDFPSYCFVLPILEVKTTDGVSKLSLNVAIADSGVEKAIALLQDLLVSTEGWAKKAPSIKIQSECRVINFLQWESAIATSAQLLLEGTLQKIVLANAHDFFLDGPIDPVWLLMQLNRRSLLTYRFLFQLSAQEAFVGASPEQLYARNGQRIESEAQAGTRPRGEDATEDASLAQELFESKKEFVEHDVVVRDIENALGALCRDSGWIDQRKVIKLSHVQHLRSRFGGILRDGVTDAQIIQALHPTPAVCGWPKELAKERIAELENFDRGYYCGPVGMMGKSKTEFAVALRSALVSKHRVRVFAGAGIVDGSIAENEWNEIDSKMRLYYDILGKQS